MEPFDRRLWAMEHAVRLMDDDVLVEDIIAVANFLCGKFDPPSTPTFNPPANQDPEQTKRAMADEVPEESIEAAQKRLNQEEEQRAHRIAERQKDLAVIRAAKTQRDVQVSTVDPEKVTEIREGIRRLVGLLSVTGQVKVQQRDLQTLSTVLDELLGPIDG